MEYSTNELELLGVVWATEHFKNYLCGAKFEIVTDHKALLSAWNSNESNKIMPSRLTRWVNRLWPFNFKIKHIPGKNMGFTEILSRLPSRKALPTSHYDNDFVVANTISNLDCNYPMGGKKELTLYIPRSFFSNILNYVNDTIRICNSNHSRSESYTSGCIPLNISKFNFNFFHLLDKTYFFFLSQSLLSVK